MVELSIQLAANCSICILTGNLTQSSQIKRVHNGSLYIDEAGWDVCVAIEGSGLLHVEEVIPKIDVGAIRQHVDSAHLEAIAENEASGVVRGRQTDKNGVREKCHRLHPAVGTLLGREVCIGCD